jgi:hypothetical protein
MQDYHDATKYVKAGNGRYDVRDRLVGKEEVRDAGRLRAISKA